MSRRIVVNLAFFAAIGIALAIWAVTNVISFDFVERPYRVTAEFATSPGLSPYFEVTYLGQKVGAIDSVDLEDGMVRVELEIERSTSLPAAVDAHVRRKSAVGEPYVDLVPSPDTDPAAGPRLAGGDLIPLSRTFTPLAYSDLFVALDELVAAIPPDALRTLLHELAVGLEGRAESLRSVVVGTDDLTSSLAANVDLLDAFLSELTRLTHTFADHRESVTGAADDLAALSASLAQADADVAALLEDGTTFTSRLADLVAAAKADLGCTIDGLGALGARFDPTTVAALERLISLSPEFLFVLEGIRDPDGFSRGTIGFGGGVNTPPVYAEPLTPPVPPAVPECAAAAGGGGGADAGPGVVSGGSDVAGPVEPGEPSDDDDGTAAAPAAPSEGDRVRGPGSGGDDPPWWLVVLAVAASGAVWRWFLIVRRRGGTAVVK